MSPALFRFRNLLYALPVIGLLLPGAAFSLPGASIVYTQSKIIIEPAPAVQEQKEQKEAPPPAPRQPVELTVNIRPLPALYKEGFYANQPFKGVDGILFAADFPDTLQVTPVNFYARADILAVDEEGVITHILPNLVPAEMTHSIALPGKLLALLYLPGEFSSRHGIQPKDKVVHSIFTKQPLILQ